MKVKTQKMTIVNKLNKDDGQKNSKSPTKEKKKAVQAKPPGKVVAAKTKKANLTKENLVKATKGNFTNNKIGVKNATKNQGQLKNGNTKVIPKQAAKPLVNKKAVANKKSPAVSQVKPESEEEEDESEEEDVADENEDDDEEQVADEIEDDDEEEVADENEDDGEEDENEDDDEVDVADENEVEEEEADDEEEDAEAVQEDDSDEDGNENDLDEGPEEVSTSKEEEVKPPVTKAKKEKKNKNASESITSYTTGPPSKSIPKENLLYIKNVPENFATHALHKILSTFGDILNIHRQGKEEGNDIDVSVAFASKESALAAILMKGFLYIDHMELPFVSEVFSEEMLEEMKPRIVSFKNSDEIIDYISSSGEIEYLYQPKIKNGLALIVFATQEGVENALKKHNTNLNGCQIIVRLHCFRPDFTKTIQLYNCNQLESLEPETLNKIFEDCGEIDKMDVLCNKVHLANITFKEKESMDKALEMNGKVVEGIELKIRPHLPKDRGEHDKNKPKTTVFVSNIPPSTTENQIREFFEKSEQKTIKKVSIFNTNATIEFETVDDFCNAFRLDEATFNGNKIYIKPNYSKSTITSKRPYNPNSSGGGGPPPKRRFNDQSRDNTFQKYGFTRPNMYQGDRQNNFPRGEQSPQNGGQQFRGKPFFQKGQGKPFVKRDNGFQQNQGGPRNFQKKNGPGPKFFKPNQNQ